MFRRVPLEAFLLLFSLHYLFSTFDTDFFFFFLRVDFQSSAPNAFVNGASCPRVALYFNVAASTSFEVFHLVSALGGIVIDGPKAAEHACTLNWIVLDPRVET